MAEEKRREEAAKSGAAAKAAVPTPVPTPVPAPAEGGAPAGQRIRISFEGVRPEYANFCTLTLRGDEIYLSFGRAFGPTTELKIETQIVMSVKNVEQLHVAMGRLLEQATKVAAGK
jgi:hypothetical protein